MKIDFMSDLHLDFYVNEKNPQSPKFTKQIMEFCNMINLGQNGADTFIIPGDLGHYNQQDQEFLKICKRFYKNIILVRGNHDMYLVSNTSQKRYNYDSTNRYLEMKNFCRYNGIHYLDGNIISIGGVTFAGVGMSWDKSYYEELKGPTGDGIVKEFFNNYMNDSKLIFGNNQDNISVPTAYGGRYRQSGFDPFEYFRSEYQKLQSINDFDNVDVMVTHYLPMNPPNSPYTGDPSTTFYIFDGKKDISRISPKFWLFGHTHKVYDFMEGDTRMMCNPCGYPGENLPTKIKTIEI